MEGPESGCIEAEGEVQWSEEQGVGVFDWS